MTSEDSLTYKAAGVDIDAGDLLVERILPGIRRTRRPEVIGEVGGFGGLFKVPGGYSEPVLVAGTDGVGTKLKLALEHDAHDTIGIDLVAMSVNDVLVVGAEPLFFLDYYVSQRLEVEVAARVIAGIARGCELAGAALIGGETAEHPGMHAPGEYDLAGFCVGIVERGRILDGSRIALGDRVIGLASSGLHSNGYSLVRRVLERHPEDRALSIDGRPLYEHLLAPTRIYARSVRAALAVADIKGMAHITGGGLIENIPRVLPDGLGVKLLRQAWRTPPVFDWLRRRGVPEREMWRTFNCGLGMIVVCAPEAAKHVLERVVAAGEEAWMVGEVVAAREARVEVA